MPCILHLTNQEAHLINIDGRIKNSLLLERQDPHKLKDLLKPNVRLRLNKSLPYKDRDHALFVAFAPYQNPKYAISVLVEHGGSGGKTAAPIAKK